jgi:hypothetical protein
VVPPCHSGPDVVDCFVGVQTATPSVWAPHHLAAPRGVRSIATGTAHAASSQKCQNRPNQEVEQSAIRPFSWHLRPLKSISELSQGSHKWTSQTQDVSIEIDSRQRAGFTMTRSDTAAIIQSGGHLRRGGDPARFRRCCPLPNTRERFASPPSVRLTSHLTDAPDTNTSNDFFGRSHDGQSRVSQGPRGVALPIGPWEFRFGRFRHCPSFHTGSC